MNFLRKYIILIITLVIVIALEVWTNKSLNTSIYNVKNMIQNIETTIDKNDIARAKKEFSDTKEYWKSRLNILSFFTEHGELEKINNCLARIEANFKANEKDSLIENMGELKFLLEHIEEKSQLKWKNIF